MIQRFERGHEQTPGLDDPQGQCDRTNHDYRCIPSVNGALHYLFPLLCCVICYFVKITCMEVTIAGRLEDHMHDRSR